MNKFIMLIVLIVPPFALYGCLDEGKKRAENIDNNVVMLAESEAERKAAEQKAREAHLRTAEDRGVPFPAVDHEKIRAERQAKLEEQRRAAEEAKNPKK